MPQRHALSLLLLGLVVACGACGEDRPAARSTSRDAAPAAPVPPDAALAPWVDVDSEGFTVQMPARPADLDGSFMYRSDAGSYTMHVEALPAHLLILGPEQVYAQLTKVARSRGVLLYDREYQAAGYRGRELGVLDDAGGVRAFMAFLLVGRRHIQLTALYPEAAVDEPAARRFLGSLKPPWAQPQTRSFECDAFLVDTCARCGPRSPACKFAINPGASAQACAVESGLAQASTPALQQKTCKAHERRKYVDVSAMEGAAIDTSGGSLSVEATIQP